MRRLCRSAYYLALARESRGVNNLQITIVRRDTFELIAVETVPVNSNFEVLEIASKNLEKLSKPDNWNAPHRKCIAFFIKMQCKREKVFDLICESNLSPEKISICLHRNEGFIFHILRMVNSLDDVEKLKMLTPGENERLNDRSMSDIDLIFARAELFWLLFIKTPILINAYNEIVGIVNALNSEFGRRLSIYGK